MARILVGIDGSGHSKEAARLAVRLAARLGEAVTFAYVVPPLVPQLVVAAAGGADALLCEHFAYAKDLTQRLAAELAQPGVAITSQVMGGDPAAALADLACDHDVELVVVGSHGLNRVERMLLGSVTTKLTRTCTKPVLVVPPSRPPARTRPSEART